MQKNNAVIHNTTESSALQHRIAERDMFRIVADFTYDWEYWRLPDNSFIYMSPSSERITGYKPEDFYANLQLLEHIIHPDDKDEVILHLYHELQQTSHCTLEFRIITRNGAERWIEHICQPVLGNDGEYLGRRASNRDVTERHHAEEALRKTNDELEHRVQQRTAELEQVNQALQAEIRERVEIEEALRKSESRYREVSELTSDSVYSVFVAEDGSLTHEWGLDNFEKLTGYTLDELPLNDWQQIVVPEDSMITQNRLAHFAVGEPVESEYRIVTKEGKIRWFRDHGKPVWNEDNTRIVRIYGAVQDVTRFKEASIARHESEERFRQLAENIQQVFWLRDSTRQHMLYVSPAYEQVWGQSCQSLYDEPNSFLKAIHPEDYALVQNAYHRYLYYGQFDEEYRIVLDDGTIRWIWAQEFPIYNTQGEIYRHAGIAEDITVRKRAEESLRQREETYRAMFEKNMAIKMLIDPKTAAIADANTGACFFYGYPSETLRKMCLTDVTVSSPEEVLQSLQQAAGEYQQHFIFQQRLSSGSIREIEMYASPIEVRGRLLLYTIIFDVTERTHAEQQLQQNIARIESLAHVAARLNAQLDLETTLHNVCEETCQALHVPIAAISLSNKQEQTFTLSAQIGIAHFEQNNGNIEISIPHTIVETIHQQQSVLVIEDVHAQPELPCFDNLLLHRIKTMVCAGVMREGTLIGILNVFTIDEPRAFTDEEIQLIQGIANQAAQAITNARLFETVQQERKLLAQRVRERTTELSIANAELSRAVHAKDEFLANMSHELRTPLNAILGLSESLQEYTYGPINEKQLQILGMIESSGRHLLSLINDILDLSKIESGQMELSLDSVTIEMLCQSSLQLIKQQARKKHLEVLYQSTTNKKTMWADVRRMKQILVNLLSNAVKFTPSGGKIGLDVEINAAGDTITFTVWDTGIGISNDHMDKLFKPFVQIDSSLAREHEGTGLGLALVARLSEMHGGSVGVESVLNKGSRFVITLPLIQKEADDVVSEQSKNQEEIVATTTKVSSVQGQKLIVLAEDNESTIQVFTDFLKNKGYNVVVARNGYEAIERVREEHPDLVLMDIQMPAMDGLEATRRIRADTSLSHLPIIALTALAMPGDRERCLKVGADEYMSKPVNLRDMVRLIETHIQTTHPNPVKFV